MHGVVQPVGWVSGVAKHEARWPGALAVPGQGVHKHAGVSGGFGEVGVVEVVGQVGQGDEQVQSGGDALHVGAGVVMGIGWFIVLV